MYTVVDDGGGVARGRVLSGGGLGLILRRGYSLEHRVRDNGGILGEHLGRWYGRMA